MAMATPDEVRQADADRWGSIGNGIKNWWESLLNMPGKADREALGKTATPYPSRTTTTDRVLSASSGGGVPQDILGGLRGKYNSTGTRASTVIPDTIRRLTPQEERQRDIDEIRERLKAEYSFNPNRTPIDTSAIDEALNARLAQINEARGQANTHFAEGDKNINDMHTAFSEQIRGQEGAIRDQGQRTQNDIAGTFNSTIQENKDGQAQYNAQREEMLQRLGIQGSANAPDLVGQAFQEGTNSAQNSRDARVSEQQGLTDINLTRNTGMANSVTNQGIQRRSELRKGLQDILGELSVAESNYQADAANARMQLTQQAQDRDYERWMAERQFDIDTWDRLDAETERQQDFEQEMAKINGKASGPTGYAGMGGNPEARAAFQDALAEKGADPRNVGDMWRRIKANPKYAHLNPDEVLAVITDYNNLD